MIKFFTLWIFFIIISCSKPIYVSEDNISSKNPLIEKVLFQLDESFDANSIDCISVLPFKKNENISNIFNDKSLLTEDITRKSFYSHLAPYSFKDIEINKLDYLYEKFSLNNKSAKTNIYNKYNCNYFIDGYVKKLSKKDFKIYSSLLIELEIKLTDYKNNKIIWKASKTNKSRGGDIPLSPLSIINGAYKSYQNTQDEQIFNLIDEMSRHLINALPKPTNTIYDEPIYSSNDIDEDLKDFENFSSLSEKEKLLLKLYDENPNTAENVLNLAEFYYNYGDYIQSLNILEKNSLIIENYDYGFFLIARNQIRNNQSEKSIINLIKAIQINKQEVNYFNLLGYAYSINNFSDKAIAAYQMALDLDSENSFAHYNMGLEFYTQGKNENAVIKLLEAGKFYAKDNNKNKILMVLETLILLEKNGVYIKSEGFDYLESQYYDIN